MASQPSIHSEERNRLRLRAWEQRNQETSQAKELNPENVPLFGEPYKTNKGDELSHRVQRMLGSYEDGNNQYPSAVEPLPIPVTFSQSDQDQPNTDKPTKPLFHNQVHCMSSQSQKAPSSNGFSSQPARTTAPSSSPNQDGHSSSFSNMTLNSSQPSISAHQQRRNEGHTDLRERDSLPHQMSSQSPEAKTPLFPHSTTHDKNDTDVKDRSSESASTMDVPIFNLKQSPKDASLPQANKGSTLPSQTFPSLLSSKQPNTVMPQKPTAYVRPMDGQDQVISESPELKPSPEPYVPLSDLINKTKMLSPFLETNEVQRVEDILREMTHSWPPLLTAIQTPKTDEPFKSPFPAKEAEYASSCPGQKNHESSPADLSQLVPQSSSLSFKAAHSREVESASSSDSECSSRSESDSESTTEPPQLPLSNSVKIELDAPAVAPGDWQLGNWIRSSQQNSSIDGQSGVHVSESPAHKQPPPTKSSHHSLAVEVVDPTRESKPQQHCESPQDNDHHSPSADLNSSTSRKLSCNTHTSKPAKTACPAHSKAAPGIKCEEVVAPIAKDPCFTDRPKVKTKTGHKKRSKEKSETKRDSKRTSSGTQPAVTAVLCGSCSSCGARYPNPCSCPTQSPAPPPRISCSKSKSETIFLKGKKIPHKTTHKNSEKVGHLAKSSQDAHRPPKSLLVKIDLSQLSRVPQVPAKHNDVSSNAKRPALVIEQAASTRQKLTKTIKKSSSQNVDVDDTSHPRKKQKLESKKNSSATRLPVKQECSSKSKEDRAQKKAKKNPTALQQTHKAAAKGPKVHKVATCREPQEFSKETVKSKDSHQHRKTSGKHKEHFDKKPSKSSLSSSQPTREGLSSRPLFKLENRHYPVKHYIKEAKKLKHKADAESDKLTKAFNYLDAAMFFVESGIAMEKDPHISTSSYTMFAETVELLKFVLKLKNSVDASATPTEKDFLALCLKCQALLQMAMFRLKYNTALKYSKTLTDHFSNSTAQDPSSKVTSTPSYTPNMPSPASTSTSSNHSVCGLPVDPVASTVTVPQAIGQVAFTYVNITTLSLSAHDLWEQAEQLAQKGSGMLSELDTLMGPLSLTSSMSSMVCYTRQGVYWLRHDSQKQK